MKFPYIPFRFTFSCWHTLQVPTLVLLGKLLNRWDINLIDDIVDKGWQKIVQYIIDLAAKGNWLCNSKKQPFLKPICNFFNEMNGFWFNVSLPYLSTCTYFHGCVSVQHRALPESGELELSLNTSIYLDNEIGLLWGSDINRNIGTYSISMWDGAKHGNAVLISRLI